MNREVNKFELQNEFISNYHIYLTVYLVKNKNSSSMNHGSSKAKDVNHVNEIVNMYLSGTNNKRNFMKRSQFISFSVMEIMLKS